jgi:hypothetical protein
MVAQPRWLTMTIATGFAPTDSLKALAKGSGGLWLRAREVQGWPLQIVIPRQAADTT